MQPFVFALCSNGPDALKKYEGDKAVLDAYMEAAEMIQEAHKEQQAAQVKRGTYGMWWDVD